MGFAQFSGNPPDCAARFQRIGDRRPLFLMAALQALEGPRFHAVWLWTQPDGYHAYFALGAAGALDRKQLGIAFGHDVTLEEAAIGRCQFTTKNQSGPVPASWETSKAGKGYASILRPLGNGNKRQLPAF